MGEKEVEKIPMIKPTTIEKAIIIQTHAIDSQE